MLTELVHYDTLPTPFSSATTTTAATPPVAQFAARRIPRPLPRAAPSRRLFHASTPAYVQIGDKVPNVELHEGSPGNKVKIADELKAGKGLIIGKSYVLVSQNMS